MLFLGYTPDALRGNFYKITKERALFGFTIYQEKEYITKEELVDRLKAHIDSNISTPINFSQGVNKYEYEYYGNKVFSVTIHRNENLDLIAEVKIAIYNSTLPMKKFKIQVFLLNDTELSLLINKLVNNNTVVCSDITSFFERLRPQEESKHDF